MLIDKLFKPKECGEQDYYEIGHFEYKGNKYAALIRGNDRNNIVLQRVVKEGDKEYLDPLENKEEFFSAFNQFLTVTSTRKRKTSRRLTLVILAATVAAFSIYTWYVFSYTCDAVIAEMFSFCLLLALFLCICHFPASPGFSMKCITHIAVLSLAYTAIVLVLNNLWRYIKWNVWILGPHFLHLKTSGKYWPYFQVLVSDFNYRIGIGAYRYWIVFFIAAIALTIKYVTQMSLAKRRAWWEV